MKLNQQSMDIVRGMREAGSVPECCDLCGSDLDGNVYSPFATVCKSCADTAVEEERGHHD